MLVGGNLPPAGGNLCSDGGARAPSRSRMEGTVNSYRRTSEKYELGLFRAFLSFLTSTSILRGAYSDSFFECWSLDFWKNLKNLKEVRFDD